MLPFFFGVSVYQRISRSWTAVRRLKNRPYVLNYITTKNSKLIF